MGLVHYSQNPQTSLFNNFCIKNGSHSAIHRFKNYFTTVFLVFSFQLYPNGPLNSSIFASNNSFATKIKKLDGHVVEN